MTLLSVFEAARQLGPEPKRRLPVISWFWGPSQQEQFEADLRAKLKQWFAWLSDVEDIIDTTGVDCTVFIQPEEPYTTGGPFTRVPRAIISAPVSYRGEPVSRRAMILAIQTMQAWGDAKEAAPRIVRELKKYSRPESEVLPS